MRAVGVYVRSCVCMCRGGQVLMVRIKHERNNAEASCAQVMFQRTYTHTNAIVDTLTLARLFDCMRVGVYLLGS